MADQLWLMTRIREEEEDGTMKGRLRWFGHVVYNNGTLDQTLCSSSSSRVRVIYHNWSATKQRPHPQSVAEMPPFSCTLCSDRH